MQPTARTVTARQAAVLTGLSEKTIRRQIAAGKIPAEKVAPNRYHIPVSSLPPYKSSPVRELTEQLETLQGHVRMLEDRLAALETRPRERPSLPSLDALRFDSERAVTPQRLSTPPRPKSKHSASGNVSPVPPDSLKDRQAAAWWLDEHGIGERTAWTLRHPAWAKQWDLPRWLTKREIFEDAIARQQRNIDNKEHRSQWRLHECADEACICHELLPQA
jgi:excisionase family DNA binding protein